MIDLQLPEVVKMYIGIVLCTGLWIAFNYAAYTNLQEIRKQISNAKPVQAVVQNYQKEESGLEAPLFVLEEGAIVPNTQELILDGGYWNTAREDYPLGSKVTVLYNPSYSDRVFRQGWKFYLMTGVMFFAANSIPLFLALMIYFRLRQLNGT